MQRGEQLRWADEGVVTLAALGTALYSAVLWWAHRHLLQHVAVFVALLSRRTPPTPGRGHTSVPDGLAGEGVPAAKPQTPRRAFTAARMSPSRGSDPHPFNDPCNYLG